MASILIIGAGELGTQVVKHLAAHPSRPSDTTLTVLLRPSTLANPSAQQSIDFALFRELGVTILPGDIASLADDALAATLAPFHTVVSCLGYGNAIGAGTQTRLARAALAAHVPRYFPWQFGVDYDVIGPGSAQPLFDEQLEVRALLRAQDATRWTIISTGIFTSFLFSEWYGVVDLKGPTPVVRALGAWEHETTATTAADIGRMVAEIAYAEPAVDGVVHIAGDTVSYARVAEIVERVTRKEVQRELWDVPRLEQELARDPGDTVKKYRVVFGKGKGVAWSVDSSYNGEKGIKLTTVEDWAKANLH